MTKKKSILKKAEKTKLIYLSNEEMKILNDLNVTVQIPIGTIIRLMINYFGLYSESLKDFLIFAEVRHKGQMQIEKLSLFVGELCPDKESFKREMQENLNRYFDFIFDNLTVDFPLENEEDDSK